MAILVPKETLGLKVSPALLDSKETPEHRDFQGLKEPLEHLERRVRQANQGCRACRELMDHRATQERKDLLVRKEIWDPLELRDQLAILDPEV